MTREMLKQIERDFWEEKADPIDMAEIFDLAQKALSQEPTEKPMTVDEMEREYEKSKALFHKIVECDDAISREDALNCLNGAWGDYSVLNEVYERISKLPPVTQKSGKWIHFAQSDDCSLCGYSTGKYGSPSKYCPNCGARMESEDKE